MRPAQAQIRGPMVSLRERVHLQRRGLTGLPVFCLLLLALCFLPSSLHAQGCAMCYTSASAARSTAKIALANGTLILLVPPMLFFLLISVVVYRYRNRYREGCVADGSWSSSQEPRFRTPQSGGTEIMAERNALENECWKLTKHGGQSELHEEPPWARQ